VSTAKRLNPTDRAGIAAGRPGYHRQNAERRIDRQQTDGGVDQGHGTGINPASA
jgi:hypothetical protein